METVFIVACGSEILGQTDNKEDAMEYLKETYGDNCLKCEGYQPKCQGLLEEWKGDKQKLRIITIYPGNMDIVKLLEEADVKREVRIPKPAKPVKNIATTPTRTRLVTGKKTPPIPASEIPEGTIKLGNDGKQWINKKKGNGFKWVRYYEETHDGLERKRKAPMQRAKQFKEGTIKKGEDGRDWLVKKVTGNKFRWVRYN